MEHSFTQKKYFPIDSYTVLSLKFIPALQTDFQVQKKSFKFLHLI